MRALIVLLLLLPSAAGLGLDNPHVSTATTLFPHVLGSQDMPMNLEAPPAFWAHSEGLGIATHSQGCVDVPFLGLASSTHHSFYAYPYPAPLDYQEADVRPGVPRGIAHDLLVDTNVTPVLRWFVETEAVTGTGVPAPVAQVRLTATIREGSAISVNHEAMNSGKILAFGQSEPILLAAGLTDGATYHEGDGTSLYEFRQELSFATQDLRIAKNEAFNLRIDMHVDVPGCNDAGERYVMPDFVRIHTSEGKRPTLTFNIFNPIVIQSFDTSFHNGTASASAQISSPWGRYNVPPPQLNLTHEAGDLSHQMEHVMRGETGPLRSHWTWTPEGNGNVTLLAFDGQGNGPAMATSPFSVGSQVTTCTLKEGQEPLCHNERSGKDSPGVFLLAPLLLALLRRRAQ